MPRCSAHDFLTFSAGNHFTPLLAIYLRVTAGPSLRLQGAVTAMVTVSELLPMLITSGIWSPAATVAGIVVLT
jgi:hypothetical protein